MTTPTARCSDCNWIVPDHREDCPKFVAHQAYLAKQKPKVNNHADMTKVPLPGAVAAHDRATLRSASEAVDPDAEPSTITVDPDAPLVVTPPLISDHQRKLYEETIARDPILQQLIAERVKAVTKPIYPAVTGPDGKLKSEALIHTPSGPADTPKAHNVDVLIDTGTGEVTYPAKPEDFAKLPPHESVDEIISCGTGEIFAGYCETCTVPPGALVGVLCRHLKVPKVVIGTEPVAVTYEEAAEMRATLKVPERFTLRDPDGTHPDDFKPGADFKLNWGTSEVAIEGEDQDGNPQREVVVMATPPLDRIATALEQIAERLGPQFIASEPAPGPANEDDGNAALTIELSRVQVERLLAGRVMEGDLTQDVGDSTLDAMAALLTQKTPMVYRVVMVEEGTP